MSSEAGCRRRASDLQGIPRADMKAFDRLFVESVTSRFLNVTITGPEGAENVFGGRMSPKGFRSAGNPARGYESVRPPVRRIRNLPISERDDHRAGGRRECLRRQDVAEGLPICR